MVSSSSLDAPASHLSLTELYVPPMPGYSLHSYLLKPLESSWSEGCVSLEAGECEASVLSTVRELWMSRDLLAIDIVVTSSPCAPRQLR